MQHSQDPITPHVDGLPIREDIFVRATLAQERARRLLCTGLVDPSSAGIGGDAHAANRVTDALSGSLIPTYMVSLLYCRADGEVRAVRDLRFRHQVRLAVANVRVEPAMVQATHEIQLHVLW
jgi:hypothetical protein